VEYTAQASGYARQMPLRRMDVATGLLSTVALCIQLASIRQRWEMASRLIRKFFHGRQATGRPLHDVVNMQHSTSSAAPYCGTGYFELGNQYTAFGCTSEQHVSITIYSTALGYPTVTYSNAIYNSLEATLTTNPESATTPPNPASGTPGLTLNPASATPGSTTTSTPLTSSSTSSTPIGALVGGIRRYRGDRYCSSGGIPHHSFLEEKESD
jgi:hypothetical protein